VRDKTQIVLQGPQERQTRAANIPQLEPFIRKFLAYENHGIMRSRVLEIEASNAAVWGKSKNGDKRI